MHNDKSTASESQRRRILAALQCGPKSTYELRKIGAFQAPTRVHELRNSGYSIRTDLITIWDDEGYCHPNVALYTLEGHE